MQLNDVRALIEAEGYRIEIANIAGGHGAVSHEEKIVYIPKRTTVRGEKCLLAHELGHIRLGHVGYRNSKSELLADRYAAQILITPESFIEASLLYGTNRARIAHELDVEEWVIETYAQFGGR